MSGSVAGFDIGSQTSTVAVARKRGIDVVLNKESNRETPSIVSFTTKDRQLGTDAVGSLTVNPKNTVSQIKRLIGKRFSSPAVQRDIARFPFKVAEAPDGGCLVEVEYLQERRSFSPVQLMAMVLYDNRQIAVADGSPVTDCVVTVPVYFTEAERYAMLAATQVAGLSCLRLMNDNTATALAYGIYKTNLPETEPVTVVFVDVGNTSLQLAVVSFKKGQLQVLAHGWDRDLGGRDFDEVLFDYWCAEFDAKFGLNVRSSPRASFRLRLACEKLKKVLSANAEATIHVECLMNDVDVSGSMTREFFEELIQPLVDRIKGTCAKLMEQAGVSNEAISTVEVVGGSSRVPAVTTALADFFGKEPSRTMNAKECVSRGAALQCAMLSPIFRVRDFEVIDKVALGVEFFWEKDGQEITSVVFERNVTTLPSVKVMTLFRNSEFTLVGRYTEDSELPEGESRIIGKWVVGPPQGPLAEGEQVKVKVKARLNLHGLVTLENAQQLVEEDVEEAAPKADDTPMQDAEVAEAKADEGEPEAAAAAAGPSNGDAAAVPMETEAQPAAAAKKKRTRKVPLPVQAEMSSVQEAQVTAFHEQEAELALQDKRQQDTADRKNELEAYVYSLRGKLADSLAPYAPAPAREALTQRLNDMENWLYEEGEDETKSVYVEKLVELRKQGDPIVARAAEEATRDPAAASLITTASRYATSATSDDPKLAHIAPDEKQKVVTECKAALAWLSVKKDLQKQLGKMEDPVLLTADIKKKEDTLHRVAKPILSKPAPPPAEKEEPKEEAKPAEGAPAAGEEEAMVPSEVEIEEVDDMDTSVPVEGDVPMQT